MSGNVDNNINGDSDNTDTHYTTYFRTTETMLKLGTYLEIMFRA